MNEEINIIYKLINNNRCYNTLEEAKIEKDENDIIVQYQLRSTGESGALLELAWEEIIQEKMIYIIVMKDNSMYAIKQFKSLNEKTFSNIWCNSISIKLYFIKNSKIV